MPEAAAPPAPSAWAERAQRTRAWSPGVGERLWRRERLRVGLLGQGVMHAKHVKMAELNLWLRRFVFCLDSCVGLMDERGALGFLWLVFDLLGGSLMWDVFSSGPLRRQAPGKPGDSSPPPPQVFSPRWAWPGVHWG